MIIKHLHINVLDSSEYQSNLFFTLFYYNYGRIDHNITAKWRLNNYNKPENKIHIHKQKYLNTYMQTLNIHK